MKRFVTVLAVCLAAFACRHDSALAGSSDGLVAWWRANGSTTDSAGTNNGLLVGGATATATGLVGQAFGLDGESGYVLLSPSPAMSFGTGDFTAEMWVNLKSLIGRQPFFSIVNGTWGASGYRSVMLTWASSEGDTMRFLIDENVSGTYKSNGLAVVTQLQTNTWYHIAGVRSGGTLTLYLNGVVIATHTAAADINAGNGGIGRIGAIPPGSTPGASLSGRIDELSVYTRALSASEIAAIYAAGSLGKATVALVASPSSGGTVSGGGTYPVNWSIPISATANSGWMFSSWNDGNTQSSRTVTVPAGGATYTATFSSVPLTATITVQANPAAGGTASGGGTFDVYSQHPISAKANSAQGWIFVGWNDGNTDNPRTITVPPAGATYTAIFVQVARITVIPNPAEGGNAAGGGLYVVNSQHDISATPNTGWVFIGWNDGNMDNPRTVTVPAGGVTYTANFVQMATISVVANPSGGGSVSGGGTFIVNSQHQISATANSANGWVFTGWNDGNTQNPRTVTVVAGGAAYTANFVQMATVTVVANPSSGGTVSGGGTFVVSSLQQISATTNAGWTFTGWNDGNTQNPRTVTVPAGGVTYTANFVQVAAITVIANPPAGGSVSGGGTFIVSSQQQISATTNSGWIFTGWNDGNVQNPRTITVPAGGATFTANFAPKGPLNDDFANRTLLSGTLVSTTGWNTNATKEAGEPNHAGATGGRSVWWRWVAPYSGTVTISTAGSAFDTVLGLYKGSSVSALDTIANNDDADPSHSTSLLSAPVVAGTNYAIAVDGYGGASGAISLSLSLVPPALSFARSGNSLVLSWSTNWTDCVLESAKNITSGSWDQVTTPPTVVGANYTVTTTMPRASLFYRLHLTAP